MTKLTLDVMQIIRTIEMMSLKIKPTPAEAREIDISLHRLRGEQLGQQAAAPALFVDGFYARKIEEGYRPGDDFSKPPPVRDVAGQQAAAPPQSDEVSTGQFTSPPMGIIKMTPAPQAAAPGTEPGMVAVVARILAKRQWGEHYEGYESSQRETAETIVRALAVAPPAAPGVESEIIAVAKEMLSDHMTSEKHHPDYVLVSASAFNKLAILAVAPPPTDKEQQS